MENSPAGTGNTRAGLSNMEPQYMTRDEINSTIEQLRDDLGLIKHQSLDDAMGTVAEAIETLRRVADGIGYLAIARPKTTA
jgi:hypothetical protein